MEHSFFTRWGDHPIAPSSLGFYFSITLANLDCENTGVLPLLIFQIPGSPKKKVLNLYPGHLIFGIASLSFPFSGFVFEGPTSVKLPPQTLGWLHRSKQKRGRSFNEVSRLFPKVYLSTIPSVLDCYIGTRRIQRRIPFLKGTWWGERKGIRSSS